MVSRQFTGWLLALCASMLLACGTFAAPPINTSELRVDSDVNGTYQTATETKLGYWSPSIPGAYQFRISGGSAGAPPWSVLGDTDTGIYPYAANSLGISAGANPTLVVAQAGATVNGDLGVTGVVTAASVTLTGASDLAAIEALTGTGVPARTADNTWALRTLTAPAAGVTITNPAGVAGNPTFVLANDLAALEALASTGYVKRTGSETYSQVTTVSVADGGTGATTLTAYGVLVGNGTGAVTGITPGSSTTILTSNGTGAAPSWESKDNWGGYSTSTPDSSSYVPLFKFGVGYTKGSLVDLFASPFAIGATAPAAGTLTTLQISTDGSASAPSIARSDDTNTGIYWGAADNFNIAVAGVARVEFSPSNTVIFDAANGEVFQQGGTAAGLDLTVTLGDIGSSGNGTILTVNDGDQEIRANKPFFAESSCDVSGDFSVGGNITFAHRLVNVLGTGSLNTNQSFNVITNEGATGLVTLTLPAAAAGIQYTYYVQDSDGIKVQAAAGDTIRRAATVSASAGYVKSVVVGGSLTLVAVNATEWVSLSELGTWTTDI